MLLRRTAVLAVAFGLAVAAALGAHRSSPAGSTGNAATGARVEAIGITVADMDRSVRFYSTVLFFEKVSDAEVRGGEHEALEGVPGARLRVVRMRLGDEVVELREWRAPTGRPLPADSRSHDRWFQHLALVVNDMDQAYLWLRRHQVAPISPAPQRLPDWNPNAGGIRAFYFKDPDGHPLEIIEFPADKGDPRWRRPSERVFLGIDHTAIVVADTGASLAFWRDTLGLRVAGTSENHGPEQERLNDVAGARLRITTLRAAAGPGIELLEYLAPRDGRPAPPDARANDLAHWRIRLVAPDVPGAARALGERGSAFVSTRVAALPAGDGAPGAAVAARDPDGHALELRSR